MFPSQGFTEIVFCAVTSNEQVKVRESLDLSTKAEVSLLAEAVEHGKSLWAGPRDGWFQVKLGLPQSVFLLNVCGDRNMACVLSVHRGFVQPSGGVQEHHTS